MKLVDKQKLKPIAPSIASYYASESTYLNDSLSRTIDSFFGDFCFNCPSVLFGRAAVKALPAGHVHAFIVDQVPTRHLSSSLNNIPGDIVGVCHADELQFNFGNAFRYPNLFEEADRNYSKLLIQTLSRFVQQSDHLPKVTGQSAREVEWPASTKEHLHFVRIKLSGLELDRSRVEPRCESVWSRLRPVILKATFNETVQQLKEPQNWWVLAILIILTLIVIVWLFNCMTRCCRRSKYTYV